MESRAPLRLDEPESPALAGLCNDAGVINSNCLVQLSNSMGCGDSGILHILIEELMGEIVRN